MSWLSESVEILVAQELLQGDGTPKVHDAVVVGSGYGGAVSALRLAQHGVRVLVLERGKEYLPGDFPNDIGEAFGHVRLERDGGVNVNGYESGLYDLRMGDGIGALVGNALGGTSQINANVVLKPDPRVFAKRRNGRPVWPRQLATPVAGGDGIDDDLSDAYGTARDMLAPETFDDRTKLNGSPAANLPGFRPLKRQRLRDLGREIGKAAGNRVAVSFKPADIMVNLGAATTPPDSPHLASCKGCGECVAGCNWKAKKTLTMTYLPEARKEGARMFSGVTVLTVERADDHWIVQFVRTETRKMHRDGVKVPVHALHARHVVLSAGTFGSTEILHRSRLTQGLSLSSRLGEGLSTNGDTLSFGYSMAERVNGMGVGSSDEEPGVDFNVGPTITAMIRVDDRTDVTRSMLIQDGAIPNAIGGIFHEMISMSAALAQLDTPVYRDLPPVGKPAEKAIDWAALQPRGRANTLTLLGIGHDGSRGSIRYDRTKDRLQLSYPTDDSRAVADRHSGHLKNVAQLGAIFIPNPAVQPLPDGVSDVLSGPEMNSGAFTVHPLGGCCMADNGASGVVNHLGQVFSDDAQTLHQGLYVLDGSIVPTSLGANPLFTITALAERSMKQLAPRIAADATEGATKKEFEHPRLTAEPDLNPHAREVDVNFTEAMRARDGGLLWYGEPCNAHLLLHLPVDNLELFGQDGRHLIVIPSQTGAQRRDKEQLSPHLNIDRHIRPKLDGNGVPEPAYASTTPPEILARLRIDSGWVSILPVPMRRRMDWRPFLRTALTWFIERGRDEIVQAMPFFGRGADKSGASFAERLRSFLKLCRHASENRVMEYRLHLRDEAPRNGYPVRSYVLDGTKEVGYAASGTALRRYIFGGVRPLERTNVWKAFGQLNVTIKDDDGEQVGSGLLELDMLDMTRMHAPQLAVQRDTPNALLALAGYPLWFARLLVKTRLWDFRLPDYPSHVPPELIPDNHRLWRSIPVPQSEEDERKAAEARGEKPASPEPLWPDFPPLRIYRDAGSSLQEIPACPSQEFTVDRNTSDNSRVALKLTRYRQQDLQRVETGDGVVQFKVMLMLNGFAQSTLGFVPQEHVRRPVKDNDEPGLAEFFYEQGYEVWLFDYRTSSILEASKQACSMDDIAQFDIPVAVDRIRAKLAEETGVATDAIRLFAFAHCVGAASLAMSLLGGHLKDRLAGVTFSQMQAFLIGSKTAQMRLRVGGILRDTLGIEYLRLSAAERKPTVLESMLDRLYASLPVDPGEHCPHEFERATPRPAICTCKRMSGTISRLLKHDRIKLETHDRLPVYFGRANTSLLVHGGRCVDNERLVNADGQNVYVTDENIAAHLNLPVAILHGQHNALFSVESAHRTHDQLRRVNPQLHAAQVLPKIIAPDYGHFDCTIGYGPTMQKQILEPLRDFYKRAWNFRHASQPPVALEEREERTLARAPLSGPIVGWSRIEERDGKQYRLVRLWIEVDESESLGADWVATYCTYDKPKQRRTDATDAGNLAGPGAQLWRVLRVPLTGAPRVEELDPAAQATAPPSIAIGLADLEFELKPGESIDYKVHMFSINSPLFKARAGSAGARTPATAASRGTPALPDPLTPDEVERAFHDGSLPFNFKVDLSEFAGDMSGSEHSGSEGRTIVPAGPLPPQQAQSLWKTMMIQQRDLHELAQQAAPPTLSRRQRRLALPLVRSRGVASLKAETIAAPLAPAGVVFLAASCRHPGLASEDRRADATLARISQHLDRTAARPAFMLMLGDQIYADATAGVMDSPSAIEKIVMSHQRAFGTPAFINLTSSLPTYMVIDDHEIADGWSKDLLDYSGGASCTLRGTQKQVEAEKLLVTARAAFAAYQWAHGPRNGNVDAKGARHVRASGFNYHFEDGGCPFFVLDTRTERARFTDPPQVCSPAQLDELDRWLDQFDRNDKRPKFVVSGSVLAPGLRAATLPDPAISDLSVDTWQMAQNQRMRVFDAILSRRIRNVVFLSGDFHCAATATITIGDLAAYAIVAPPLYAQLPAANVKKWQIAAETLQLPAGGPQVSIKPKKSSGDGFAEVRALPLPDGRWQLEIGYFQMNSARKGEQREDHSRSFILD